MRLSRTIPLQAPNYIERTPVEKEIVEKLLSTDKRIIVLVALPGMGKTQVAIYVSHLLQGKKRRVLFVQKQETLSNICSQILHVFDEDQMTGNDDNVVLQATRKMSELQEDIVIVLDNTEDIQDQDQEKFDGFVRELLTSAPKVKLMITTRRDLNAVAADMHRVHLEPMDTKSSVKLFKDVVEVYKECIEEVCRLCGGMPLFLIHCLHLLEYYNFNPTVLVDQLRNDPVHIIRNNVEDVYNLLGKFLRKSSGDVKRNLVRVSVFPSTFSATDMLILFDNEAEVETAKTKMHSFLQETGTKGEYSVHPLVQAFCREEGGSLDVGDEVDRAKKKFNDHYLERIKILSKQFITKDKASEAISTYRKEKLNIAEAFKNCFEHRAVKDEKLFAIDVANSTEVRDFLAKVLLPTKECTQLYEKCCEISEHYDDKERLADSLNSFGFLSTSDVFHLKDDQRTLSIFQKAYDIRKEFAEDKQKCETHAHTISKLGLCSLFQVTTFYS